MTLNNKQQAAYETILERINLFEANEQDYKNSGSSGKNETSLNRSDRHVSRLTVIIPSGTLTTLPAWPGDAAVDSVVSAPGSSAATSAMTATAEVVDSKADVLAAARELLAEARQLRMRLEQR